jgi:nucleoside 2-deoxyribosyltransferase
MLPSQGRDASSILVSRSLAMKIYIAHSNNFNFKDELYLPLRRSLVNEKHEIILPHENSNIKNSKQIIRTSDVVIAEVSYPATGEGIELGWADAFKKPIICMYKARTSPANSLKTITNNIVSYTNSEDMLNKIEAYLSELKI